MKLHLLLKTDELFVRFTHQDGFTPSSNCRHHQIELKIEPGQDVRHELFVFKLLASRCHPSINAFTLVKYSLVEDAPLDVVVIAILVLMTRARDWDANIPSMVAQAADAVSMVESYERISHENKDNR